MKLIQLFDIKTRTLGFAFCQPPKKSLPKSLTQKKSLQNFKPKKSPQMANFKPKKGLRTSPSLIYLSTPPGDHRLFEGKIMVSVIKLDLCLLNFVCFIATAKPHRGVCVGLSSTFHSLTSDPQVLQNIAR